MVLNFPPQFRNSPDVCRVLSIIPPGVSAYEVINTLFCDSETGRTEGFLDIDANGIQRLIFLDAVGILGDTPSIDHGLDVAGHTAAAPCQLCNYKRRNGKDSCCTKYGELHDGGDVTSNTRSVRKHSAVIECVPQKHTMQILGFRKTENHGIPVLYRLHDLVKSYQNEHFESTQRNPSLPNHFHPYLGSLITPDHLMSGLFKKTTEFASSTLPKGSFYEQLERKLIRTLR